MTITLLQIQSLDWEKIEPHIKPESAEGHMLEHVIKHKQTIKQAAETMPAKTGEPGFSAISGRHTIERALARIAIRLLNDGV